MRKVRNICLSLIIAGLFVVPQLEGADRVIEESFDAAGLKTLSLEVGVGDVNILQDPAETKISLTIKLHPRRGGLFSSLREGEKQVQEAELKERRGDKRLELSVSAGKGDHRFEENWELRIPAGLGLDIEVGVGDLSLEKLSADADIEIGVGDADIVYESGNLDLEIGVGDAEISAPRERIRTVSAESGVGDVQLLDGKREVEGEGMVGHSLDWTGEGSATLEVESGVGDIEIRLE